MERGHGECGALCITSLHHENGWNYIQITIFLTFREELGTRKILLAHVRQGLFACFLVLSPVVLMVFAERWG